MPTAARSATARLAGPLAGVDLAMQWAVRLVWLNLWWCLFTLAGGVLLGFGPATVAAHGVARRWINGETELSVPRTMGQLWRQHWGRGVAASLVVTASLLALLATLWQARIQPPIPQAVTQGVVMIALLMAVIIIPHLAWLIERDTEPSLARTFASALAVGLGRPVLTLTLGAVSVGWPTLLVVVGWPGLLPVCAVAVPVVISAWCVQRVFPVRPDRDGPDNTAPTPESGTSVT